MTLVRTSGPDGEPVSVAELKHFLRLAHDSEDILLAGLIRAAREDVERAAGVALLDQEWRLVLDRWPRSGVLLLMRHPVREVISVTVHDGASEPTVLPPSAYRVDVLSRPARLTLKQPAPGPVAINGIDVEFAAGFGAAGTDAPEALRHAVLVLAAHWYEFRAGYGPDAQPASYPPHFERLVAGYRYRRL